MTDPNEVAAKARVRLDEVVANLLQIPRFKAALYDVPFNAPNMLVQCPSRHPLIPVTLDRLGEVTPDGQVSWKPFLRATSGDAPVTVTDGWEGFVEIHDDADFEEIARNRVMFECERPGCEYRCPKSQEDLLRFYALALQTDKRTIRLPE